MVSAIDPNLTCLQSSNQASVKVYCHPENLFYTVVVNEETTVHDVLTALLPKKKSTDPDTMVYAGSTKLHEKRLDSKAFPLKVMETHANTQFKFLVREVKSSKKSSSSSSKTKESSAPSSKTPAQSTTRPKDMPKPTPEASSPMSGMLIGQGSIGRVLRSGVLEKLSKDGKQWKPRFVALVEDGVWYSKAALAPIGQPLSPPTSATTATNGGALSKAGAECFTSPAAVSSSSAVMTSAAWAAPAPVEDSINSLMNGGQAASSIAPSLRSLPIEKEVRCSESLVSSGLLPAAASLTGLPCGVSTSQTLGFATGESAGGVPPAAATRTFLHLGDVLKVTSDPTDARILCIVTSVRTFFLRSRSPMDASGWLLSIARQTVLLKEELLLRQAEAVLAEAESQKAEEQSAMLSSFKTLTGVLHVDEAARVFEGFLLQVWEDEDMKGDADWPRGVSLEEARRVLQARKAACLDLKTAEQGASSVLKSALAAADAEEEGKTAVESKDTTSAASIREWLGGRLFALFSVDALSQRRLANVPVVVRGYGINRRAPISR